MFQVIMSVSLLFSTLFSGVLTSESHLVGNARDKNDCLLSAGYQWCEASQKCIRPWMEPCEVKCPDVMCSMYCSGGFEKNNDGCSICKCKVEDKCNNWYYKTCTIDSHCKDNYSCVTQKKHCLASICNCKGMCTRDCSPYKGICLLKGH